MDEKLPFITKIDEYINKDGSLMIHTWMIKKHTVFALPSHHINGNNRFSGASEELADVTVVIGLNHVL